MNIYFVVLKKLSIIRLLIKISLKNSDGNRLYNRTLYRKISLTTNKYAKM